MTVTALIGALLALVPRPRPEAAEKPSQVDQLRRSHARLVDHIESLERELLIERHICRHWRDEAMRIAKQSREARAEAERERLAAARNQTPASLQEFCNCVPSRAQVWGASAGLVQRLNDRS